MWSLPTIPAFPTFPTMSLRVSSPNDEISILSILLLVGMLGILVALGVMMRKEAHVMICTPGLNPQSHETLDAIHIRIQFTPQQTVHRRRAPSALDLGPAAEVKKDI